MSGAVTKMSEAISAPDEADAATWLGFILMCLGMFMAILDIQVVATSLPAIQHALEISREAMSWIQTAYLIAEIIAIPLTGWLTRVLTLRRSVCPPGPVRRAAQPQRRRSPHRRGHPAAWRPYPAACP